MKMNYLMKKKIIMQIQAITNNFDSRVFYRYKKIIYSVQNIFILKFDKFQAMFFCLFSIEMGLFFK